MTLLPSISRALLPPARTSSTVQPSAGYGQRPRRGEERTEMRRFSYSKSQYCDTLRGADSRCRSGRRVEQRWRAAHASCAGATARWVAALRPRTGKIRLSPPEAPPRARRRQPGSEHQARPPFECGMRGPRLEQASSHGGLATWGISVRSARGLAYPCVSVSPPEPPPRVPFVGFPTEQVLATTLTLSDFNDPSIRVDRPR